MDPKLQKNMWSLPKHSYNLDQKLPYHAPSRRKSFCLSHVQLFRYSGLGFRDQAFRIVALDGASRHFLAVSLHFKTFLGRIFGLHGLGFLFVALQNGGVFGCMLYAATFQVHTSAKLCWRPITNHNSLKHLGTIKPKSATLETIGNLQTEPLNSKHCVCIMWCNLAQYSRSSVQTFLSAAFLHPTMYCKCSAADAWARTKRPPTLFLFNALSVF